MYNELQTSLFDSIYLSIREIANPLILLFILFVVSIIIISPLVRRVNGKILLSILLIFGLMSLNSMFMAFQLRNVFIYTLWTYFPLILYIPPLCFLYIQSLVIEKYKLSIKQFYHLAIPIAFTLFSLGVNVVVVLAYLREDFVLYERAMNFFIDIQGLTLFYFVVIQYVLYTILCLRVFYSHKKNIAHFFSFSEGVNLNWVAFFIFGMILYFAIFVLSNNELFFIKGISDTVYDIAHFGITVFFVFLIGVHGTKQQNVFEVSNNQIEKQDNNSSLEKESHFMKDEDLVNQLKGQIIKLMEEEKLFLNNSLTINLLSEKLASNRTYVSYVINECFQMNFYTFVNKYRVNEAIRKLQDASYKNYSIEGIASLCGFSSRSSFNIAFKKFTGKTPSDFKTP